MYYTCSILTKDSIRCHSNLVKQVWSRLYYLCRLNDQVGKGIVIFEWNQLLNVLNCASSTLWYWLKEGKCAGAFIFYKKTGNELYIRLGSKMRITRTLNLDSWGEVAYVNFDELSSLADVRSTATQTVAQAAQRKAYYSAKHGLNKEDRKKYPVVEPYKIFKRLKKERLCENGSRAPNFLILHISARYVFVSKGFIPYGTSQEAIANSLGVSERTVRRHLAEVERRQIAQSKGEYRHLHKTLLSTGGGGINESYIIEERAGHTSHYDDLKVSPARFFTCLGQTWLTRNNLYDLNYQLVGEKTARRKYKKYLSKNPKLPADCGDKNFKCSAYQSERENSTLTL